MSATTLFVSLRPLIEGITATVTGDRSGRNMVTDY